MSETQPISPKEQILQAALSVFSKKGYAGATMAEIAQEAGVNVATIYRHFEGKRQLFQALDRPDLNFPDQQEQQLRANILRKALNLFSQNGYIATTMDEIAEAVGLSKPAIYFYFPSKESLFSAAIENPSGFTAINTLLSNCLAHENDNLEEGLTRLASLYLSMFGQDEFVFPLKVILSEGVRNPEIARGFREHIVKTGSENIARYLQKFIQIEWDDLVLKVQALFGSLLAWGMLNYLMVSDTSPRPDREPVARAYARLFLFGIRETIQRND
jgi:AcrR family transcriptional regulator